MEAEERVAQVLGEWIAAHEDGEALDVEELLRRHPDLEDELRRGLSALARVDVALGTAETPRRRLPERVGGYRVLSSLGDGGMGTVYKAVAEVEDALVPVGTTVAVKCVHPHLLRKPGFYDRLRREAELGQRIRHPNVVRTCGIGPNDTEGEADHLLVMEYVEGQTLRELAEELEHLPEELCRQIGLQVARGLRAIHEAGAVHRDLKPENVLITKDNEVKVMDLGVAWLAEAQVKLSQSGLFLGSLLYASPEHIRGQDIDGRADLYALGLLLYELASGRHPFRSDDSARVLQLQATADLRPLGQLNPQTTPFLERLVECLCRKNPQDRIRSAADLERILVDAEGGSWWEGQAALMCRETNRPLRRVTIARETALHGREKQLAELGALYERVVDSDGHVVLLQGEAGIGKTRLVDEFVHGLRREGEDPHFLFGAHAPGASSSEAFAEAYREHIGSTGLEDNLARLLTVTPNLIQAFASLLRGEPTTVEATQMTPASLRTVFVDTTRALAAERPTVVLIEDLHFATENARNLFTSLARAVPGHRVLLIGSMRPGTPSEWISEFDRLEQASRLELPRLGPKDLASLLEDAFQSRHLAEELGIEIARKSDGNPFFALEIIRSLREGHLIRGRPDGSWATTGAIREIDVPSSILDLVRSRVAALPEEQRDLLEVASCLGHEFDPLLLAAVVEQPRIDVLKRLGECERRHRLVHAVGRQFIFDHHQVQESLYEGLSEPLREEFHAGIAARLESNCSAEDMALEDLRGADCTSVCKHYLLAGKGEKALRYLDRALDFLAATYRNEEAVFLARRALEVPDLLTGEVRVRVLLKLEARLGHLGRHEEERDVLAEALQRAELLQNLDLIVAVEMRRSSLNYAIGNFNAARELETKCLALARQIGDRGKEARVLANLGASLRQTGQLEEARECYERALALSSDADDVLLGAVLQNGLGGLAYSQGRFEEAMSLHSTGRQMFQDCGDRSKEALATSNVAACLIGLGRGHKAMEWSEGALAIAKEIGDRSVQGYALVNLGGGALVAGLLSEAESYAQRQLAVARELGDSYMEACAVGVLGEACLGRGRLADAEAYFRRELAACRESGRRQDEARALAGVGRVRLAQGRLADAADYFSQQAALLKETGDPRGEAMAAGLRASVLLVLGRPDDARGLLERNLALAEESKDPSARAYALAGLASVAHEQSEPGRDLELAKEALAQYRDHCSGRKAALADMLVQLGNYHLAGDGEVARSYLEEAINLLGEQERPLELAHAHTLLACSRRRGAAAAEALLRESGQRSHRHDTWYYLWSATGKLRHFSEAKRLLDYRVEHAPEEYRESMLKNVRLHREIMEAWAEHGGGEQSEAPDPA